MKLKVIYRKSRLCSGFCIFGPLINFKTPKGWHKWKRDRTTPKRQDEEYLNVRRWVNESQGNRKSYSAARSWVFDDQSLMVNVNRGLTINGFDRKLWCGSTPKTFIIPYPPRKIVISGTHHCLSFSIGGQQSNTHTTSILALRLLELQCWCPER